jgi:DNA-binding CsgD family transcriptional regulator
MSSNGRFTAPEVLEQWFRAFNSHSIEGVLTVCHPSIEIVPLALATTTPPGTKYYGREGVRSLMVPGFERYPQMKLSAGEIEPHGDSLLLSLMFDLDDGETVTHRRAMSVFQFEEGLIWRVDAFETRAEAERFIKGRSSVLLTRRERQVIGLLAEGLHAEEVANRLVISPLTVRTHIRNAKYKLGARTSGQAIAMAVRDEA